MWQEGLRHLLLQYFCSLGFWIFVRWIAAVSTHLGSGRVTNIQLSRSDSYGTGTFAQSPIIIPSLGWHCASSCFKMGNGSHKGRELGSDHHLYLLQSSFRCVLQTSAHYLCMPRTPVVHQITVPPILGTRLMQHSQHAWKDLSCFALCYWKLVTFHVIREIDWKTFSRIPRSP